jgi:hypothetical protein
MCIGQCQRVIEPNELLRKFITYLNILLIANLLVPIIRISTGNYNEILNDILCIGILYCTTQSLHFIIAGLYIMIVIINNFITFFTIGAYIQLIIQGSTLQKDKIIYLCSIIIIFQFYIFAICMVFIAYREMKAVFKESNGIQGEGALLNNNDPEINRNPNRINQQQPLPSGNLNANPNNRPANFVPFGGSGQRLD